MRRFKSVLLPAPVLPTTSVWPTSSSWRLSQRGVAVVALRVVVGNQNEQGVEAEANAARGVLGHGGGRVARHGGRVVVQEELVVAFARSGARRVVAGHLAEPRGGAAALLEPREADAADEARRRLLRQRDDAMRGAERKSEATQEVEDARSRFVRKAVNGDQPQLAIADPRRPAADE